LDYLTLNVHLERLVARKNTFLSYQHNAGQNSNISVADNTCENVVSIQHLYVATLKRSQLQGSSN